MRDLFDARRAVQLVALVLAVAATTLFVAVPRDTGSATQTLLQAEGARVLPLLLLPLVLTVVPLVWAGRGRTAASVTCTVALVLVCLAGLLTVGPFYLPAGIVGGIALAVPAHPAGPAPSRTA